MAITIKIAHTPAEIDAVFKIRHQVFFEEEKLLAKVPGERMLDRFDAFPTTSNLVVKSEGKVVGSLRLAIDCDLGVPADEYFDFRPHLPEDSNIMHCSMFCICEEFRSSRIATGLMLMATYFGMSNQVSHVVAPVNPAIARMLKRIGYEQIADEFTEPHTNARMMPLVLDVKNLSDFFIHFVIENKLHDYIGEYERVFYDENEYIMHAGDTGEQAFIVIEGTAEVRLPGNNILIDTLGEGDVFGEMALLFEEPRAADIVATSDLQVMALSKKSFQRMFFQDPKKTLNLVQTLAKRNKQMLHRLQNLETSP